MTNENLASIVDSELQTLASGFGHAEGPSWHPDGYWFFNDVTKSLLYRYAPGHEPIVAREATGGASGTTFDLEGRLVVCEGSTRRVTRLESDDRIEVIAERYEGKLLNRPNDVVCRSDGSLYFTDRGLRVPLKERQIADSAVYRIEPAGSITLVAQCEDPNGLAFSADERILYVANSRWTRYLLALDLDETGALVRRRIFADMSSDDRDGVPDGIKVDVDGRIYCAAAGGVWVFDAQGRRLGIIATPEVPTNLAFGGDGLCDLLITCRTSIYSIRLNVPGLPHPRHARPD